MRRLVVTEYVTLDGVMQDPGGSGEFARGGWSRPYWGDDIAKFKFDELFASDMLLLGRVTYEGFAAAWPTMTDEGGFADRMNGLPKYVVSTTLTNPSWTNSQVIRENVIAEIATLKQQDGQDILVAGSGQLVQTLMLGHLIDEYRLLVYPVVVGAGKRLFNSSADAKLKLVEALPFASSVTLLRYAPVIQEPAQ
jgi:dihydrofolate reductase